ncbi:DUF2061 domain-containing protein [Halobacterium wangiae]|uniref:DUF2061 domain-containing protein n=1 Tax=Halobacterium wangiae TaxID=2902623 RepID=UPI001E4DB113|nr:DUF2061 domain-containing protein [Halobacterium wangiae]
MLRDYISWRPHEARRRAIVKTLLYRALMVLVTIVVAWAVTGSATDAVNIGVAANVIKTGTYYGYERLWNRISWGVTAPER